MNQAAIGINLQENEKVILEYVYKNVKKYRFDEHTNQDITQDIMIKFYTKVATFNGNSKITTWLYSIIKNHCLNLKQKEYKNYMLSMDFNDWDCLPCKSKGIESQYLSNEIKVIVNVYVGKLPEHLRLPLCYFYYENLKYKDISQKMNIPIGTVKSRINIARMKLKKWLLTKQENAELLSTGVR